MPLSPSTSNASGQGSGNAIGQNPVFDPQSTNLLLYTIALDNGAWGGTAVVTPDSTLAPDGSLTADTLNDNSAVATLNKNQAAVIANDALPYTASAYFLAGSSVQAKMSLNLSGGVAVPASIEFNPANGQVLAASAFAYSVTAIKIGAVSWLRVQITAANNNSGNVTGTVTIEPASNGVAAQGTLIVWGSQLEKQLTATGYIPTAGQIVTRAAGKLPAWTLDNSETILAKVGVYAVDAIGDKGKLIAAAGTFTVSLPAAATAGNGFWLDIKNTGTGVITIAANGAELINVPGNTQGGVNTQTLPYSGSTTGPYNVQGFRLACDGAKWEVVSTMETHGTHRFTASGNWICPAGVTAVWLRGSGGGGGGGDGDFTNFGGYGGAGIKVDDILVAVVPGTTYAVTIGAGGGANTAGGVTSFAALLTLAGGNGGGPAYAPGTIPPFLTTSYNGESTITGTTGAVNSGCGAGPGGFTPGTGPSGRAGFLTVKW